MTSFAQVHALAQRFPPNPDGPRPRPTQAATPLDNQAFPDWRRHLEAAATLDVHRSWDHPVPTVREIPSELVSDFVSILEDLFRTIVEAADQGDLITVTNGERVFNLLPKMLLVRPRPKTGGEPEGELAQLNARRKLLIARFTAFQAG